MSFALVFALIAISLVGLGYLATTDPKRRRSHGLASLERQPLVWPSRVATFGPGILLIIVGHWSGLAIWAGAVTVLGWIIAALPPAQYTQLKDAFGIGVLKVTHTADNRIRDLRKVAGTKATSFVKEIARVLAGRVRGLNASWQNWMTKPRWLLHKTEKTSEVSLLKARIKALEARIHHLENNSAQSETRSSEAPYDTSAEVAMDLPKQRQSG
ncbi:MAG: hypothetical protein AAGA73_03025 [Pseudomonadota bacterium]